MQKNVLYFSIQLRFLWAMWSCLLRPQFMWVKPPQLLEVLSSIDLEFLSLVSPAFLVFSRDKDGEEGSRNSLTENLFACMPTLVTRISLYVHV